MLGYIDQPPFTKPMYTFPMPTDAYQRLRGNIIAPSVDQSLAALQDPAGNLLAVRGRTMFQFFAHGVLPRLDSLDDIPDQLDTVAPEDVSSAVHKGVFQYSTLVGKLVVRSAGPASRIEHPEVLLTATNIHRRLPFPWNKPMVRIAIWQTLQQREPSRGAFVSPNQPA